MKSQFISEHIEYRDEERIRLGMMSSHRWRMDPKVLLFSMARYKFVAKMFSGMRDILEVGCGDGWGAHIVAPEVASIHCVDVDPVLIEECRLMHTTDKLSFAVADLSQAPLSERRDAVYLLDVLEHVPPEQEHVFLGNIARSIRPDGACIVGIPSLESQAYASKPSRATHVNCKNGESFKQLLQLHYKNVFLFSMNDEVVHTGFSKMAHYLLGLCTCVKD